MDRCAYFRSYTMALCTHQSVQERLRAATNHMVGVLLILVPMEHSRIGIIARNSVNGTTVRLMDLAFIGFI